MLSIQEMSSIQAQTSRLQAQRQTKSEQICAQGFHYLYAAEQTGFSDKNQLKLACDAFAEAIGQNRQSADAHFGMAYLLFLLKDYSLALHYLREALNLQPDHADARALLAEIQTQAEQSPKPAAAQKPRPPMPPTVVEPDYDLLYEELEAHILAQARQCMAAPPPLPSLDLKERKRLRQALKEQQQHLQDFEQQLELLAEEFDTAPLRSRLKPLEVTRKRLQQALELSTEMEGIQQDLLGLLERLPGLGAEFAAAATAEQLVLPRRLLEALMDMCDQLADRLDWMEQQKYPVASLVQLYEHLISEVEVLHEMQDDAIGTCG